jgi:hypothetical protein
MSCTTTAISANNSISEYEQGICPVKSVEIPFELGKYVMSSKDPSYVSNPLAEELNDFQVLVTFANKVLNNEVGVDLEIQQVINDCFWDML